MITLCPEFKFLASLRPINAWLTFDQRLRLKSKTPRKAFKIILQVRLELPFRYAYCVAPGAAVI